ncbi:MAG TPA: phosphate ABC transporter substrate-binding protein PstS [Candidatus Polarisedimenticolaceae bacterium]|nr:phosphate ABC transporter substrate-binding protein PstS [Candidatus Polarisedimenticolaceae bacterium]
MRRAVLALLLGSLAACSAGGPQQGMEGGRLAITGAGATFPYPLYSRWFSDYSRQHPDVAIDYQSIGSGGGIRQLINKTVFFGATDGPMTEEQLRGAGGGILHVPTVLGAVVPAYNVPGVETPLNFTGPLLAEIFLGKVTRWDADPIRQLNPGVSLPSSDITVIHRSDGSGTTYIWVDYLSKVSDTWKSQVGVATSVAWPAGVGGKGNEGVSGLVRQTPGSIGYVELIYALQNDIDYGAVQNAAGTFVRASLASVTAAAAGAAASIPDDFRVSIVQAPGADAYPIASFTWILLREDGGDPARARAMVEFLRWALTEGQATAEDLGYARIPPTVAEKAIAALSRVRT